MPEENLQERKRVKRRHRRRKKRTSSGYNPLRESMTIFAIFVVLACVVILWFWTIAPVALEFLNETFGI